MLQWVSITLDLDFLCANIGAMGLQKLWTFQKRQIFFGLCLPWDPVLPPAMPGWRHGGKFVSTLLGSSHSSSLAYSTFRPFSAGLHLLPARGRAPGHQTGGGVWLEGCCWAALGTLSWTEPFTAWPPHKSTHKLFVHKPLYCRALTSKAEKGVSQKTLTLFFPHMQSH